jgi:uncharacterized membrane protein
MPYLSLHFSLWVPIISPFVFLFGSYTLLLFQSLALVFAGSQILKIAQFYQLKLNLQSLILLQFYSIWAVFSAIADGFHDNTIAACFVPSLFLAFLKADKKSIILFTLAILISKENMAIWALMLLPSFLLASSQSKQLWRFTAVLILFDVFYFLLVTQVLMPALNPLGKFEQLDRFSHLGNSLTSIISYIVQHPITMFKMLFFSHIQPDDMENIKHEFWMVFIASGFIASLFRPAIILAFLPLLFQKLWNKEVAFWGINYHYGIEMVPLLSISVLLMLVYFKSIKLQLFLLSLVLISTISITYLKMQERKSVWYDDKKENVFSLKHYTSSNSIHDLKPLLSQISNNDIVSCNSGLVPHLANRESVFLFPRIDKNCKILVLINCDDVYPMDSESYKKEIAAMSTAAKFGYVYKGFHYSIIAETEEAILYQVNP